MSLNNREALSYKLFLHKTCCCHTLDTIKCRALITLEVEIGGRWDTIELELDALVIFTFRQTEGLK